MSSVKLFKINTLGGKTYSFEFDCKADLKTFRLNLEIETPYTIIYKGTGFIFSNDKDDSLIEELMILTNPTMMDLDIVQCHLTLNMGFPKLRQGKLLITSEKQDLIENSNFDLACPISLQIIQYAIKINGKFYDLEAISEYLANAFNNAKDGIIPKCPMRIDLPDDLVASIYNHHYSEEKKSLYKFSKSSMQCCLYFTANNNQEEYNELIKSQ